MKWFRLYDEILDDPKMMSLSAKEFQTWILILCLANREISGKRGEICRDFATISRQIHGDFRVILPILKRFIELGLIVENGQSIKIVNWDKRQFKSDDVLQRVKRYRNVTVTSSDTDTDTNTKTKTKKGDIFISPMLGQFCNVKLSWASKKKLESQLGKGKLDELIESLSTHVASTGKVYSSHHATIYSWAVKRGWITRGNKNNGGGDDNVFLRTLREIEDGENSGRLDGKPEKVQRPRHSKGRAQSDGGVSEDAHTIRSDKQDGSEPDY